MIVKALYNMIESDGSFRAVSLFDKILAVHVFYHFSRQEVILFSQFIALAGPGILIKLDKCLSGWLSQFWVCNYLTNFVTEVNIDKSYFLLHLKAVEVALDDLSLRVDKEKIPYIPVRLHKLHLCQNAIESILSFGKHSTLREELQLVYNTTLCTIIMWYIKYCKCSRNTVLVMIHFFIEVILLSLHHNLLSLY